MGEAVETDLPKIKKVKVASEKPKQEKSVKTASAKPAKAAKAKPAKTGKPVAKATKSNSAKAAKPAKSNAKPAKAAKAAKPAKGSKNAPITNDSVANTIASLVASGKIETAKVDYANSKSVVAGLTAKAATVLLRAYSDKNVAAITHGDNDIAKAAKELLIKNASAVRSAAVTKHAKKMAGAIVKAAKAADAGKLSATDYRAIAFEV